MLRTSTPFAIGICVLTSLLLVPRLCFSQEDGQSNSLRDGIWALQFRITDDFRLSTFKGSILSAKRHYSANSALRAGISMSFATADSKDDLSIPDTTIAYDLDGDAYDIRIELQYLYYPNPDAKVNVFSGVGPFADFARTKNETMVNRDIYLRETKQWSLGLAGVLGVEWFPTEVVGIHAEYGVSAGYTSSTDNFEDRADSEVRRHDSDLWKVGGQGVLFGLSVYF